MSNTLAPPQLNEHIPQIPVGYQPGFDGPAAEQRRIDAYIVQPAETWPVQPVPVPGEFQSPAPVQQREQGRSPGGIFAGHRYQGAHRAHRDEPSTHQRTHLSLGDEYLRAALQEARADAYAEALGSARADGAGERAAEVRARSAAQAATKEFYDAAGNHRGVHRDSSMRAQAKAERTGRYQRDTLVKKAARWLTYSADETEARDQQRRDAYDQNHQVEVMTAKDGVEIPKAVHVTRSRLTPGRRELRYMHAVGALDEGSFETGNAQVTPEARELKMPLASTAEQQEVELILSGARTDQEVFNEMYGDRVAGGSTVYGGRLLAEGTTLRRKLGEAGRISTTNQDNIGPVERDIAHHYAERMAVVAYLESQVTDKFVPGQHVIEAMLYGENGEDISPDRTLTEDEMLVVKATLQRLEELREQKMRPGETVDTRVRPDRTHSIRETWRSTKEAMKDAAGKVHRVVGIVALHGAVWTDVSHMIIQPEYIPEPRNPDAIRHHAASPFEERSGMVSSSVEPIRVYSPGELVALASTWAFVRAQMIASGSLRGARDWFRPYDHETDARRVSALRIAGAAAVMVTAAATVYGYNRLTGASPNATKADLTTVQSTFGGRG